MCQREPTVGEHHVGCGQVRTACERGADGPGQSSAPGGCGGWRERCRGGGGPGGQHGSDGAGEGLEPDHAHRLLDHVRLIPNTNAHYGEISFITSPLNVRHSLSTYGMAVPGGHTYDDDYWKTKIWNGRGDWKGSALWQLVQ